MYGEIEKLRIFVKRRPAELRKLKEEGKKIVGYLPGFVPEEILNSSGAVPIGWIRGGDPEPVSFSLRYVPRWIDTYCKAQIGYKDTEEEIYTLTDLLIVPVVDANMRGIGDVYDLYTDMDVFRTGYPHIDGGPAEKYYLTELRALVKKLEDFTGNTIHEEKLREEVNHHNEINKLMREISLMRRSDRVPITGREFAFLNHSSFIVEKNTLRENLESLVESLKGGEGAKKTEKRIFLIGSSIAMGDYKVYDLLKRSGAEVVIEDFPFGIRPYWEEVKINGDLIKAIAQKYLEKRIPSAFQRRSEKRIESLISLAKEFNVDGIVYYIPMYQDAYQTQFYYFEKILREELGMPILKLETDYDVMEIGPMETRIETFVETLEGG